MEKKKSRITVTLWGSSLNTQKAVELSCWAVYEVLGIKETPLSLLW